MALNNAQRRTRYYKNFKSKTYYKLMVRQNQIWTTYRLRYIDYLYLHVKQDFKCAVCKEPLQSGRWKSIDHCHKTGKVRGLLCRHCNTAVGYLESPRYTIKDMEVYLANF